MPKEPIFNLALQILKETNPYAGHNIEDIKYTGLDDDHNYGEHTLLSFIADELKGQKVSVDARYADRINNQRCIEGIVEGMAEYVRLYPAQFAVRQQIKDTLLSWVMSILAIYKIEETPSLDALRPDKRDQDTAIAMLKELQSVKGVSVVDLNEKLGFKQASYRGIKNDLRKLDPSLCENEETAKRAAESPFRIGGQPVRVKIKEISKEHDKRKYFRTVNTLHPLVLQENLMQVGTMLQALSRNHYEHEDGISFSIAANIWYQLSDYAKRRIRLIFTIEDPDLKAFLMDLDEIFPDNRLATEYQTERELQNAEDNMSIENILVFTLKARGRRCDLWLRIDDEIQEMPDCEIVLGKACGLRDTYAAIDKDGNVTGFEYEDLVDIWAR